MENSIEENIEILEKFKNNEMQRDKLERDGRCGGWKIGDIYKCLELDNAIDNILSDYKRVLKENEELLEVKVSASAHNRILELEKENEELKNFKKQVTEIESTNFIKYKNFISKQKVKDNLIKYQEEYELLLEHQSGKESNRTKYLRGRIHMCQELLESEK